MANTAKRVFSVPLRVDAHGWQGDPPMLGGPPLVVQSDKGPTTFVYDFGFDRIDASLEGACGLLAAAIEQEFERKGSVLRDPEFRKRCRVDVAISVQADLAMFSYVWPPVLIALLGKLGIGLEASHYLDQAFEEVLSGS